jgi:uncharacterized protein (DUF2147 family)
MKRLCSATLMMLTTSAHAATVFSFEVGGRTVSINAPSGCASVECISVSRQSPRNSGPRRGYSTKLVTKSDLNKQSRSRDQTADRTPPGSLKPVSTAALVIAPASLPKSIGIFTTKTEVVPAPVGPQMPPILFQSPAPAAMGVSPAISVSAIPASSQSTTPLPVVKSSGPALSVAVDEASSHPSRTPSTLGGDTTATTSASNPPKTTASSDTRPPALAYYSVPPLPSPASISASANAVQTSAPVPVRQDRSEKQLNASTSGATDPPRSATQPNGAASTGLSEPPGPNARSASAAVAIIPGPSAKQTEIRSNSETTSGAPGLPITVSDQRAQLLVASTTKSTSQPNSTLAATEVTSPSLEHEPRATDSTKTASSDRKHSASPIGNWLAEGYKSSIRITQCGPYLCGYASSSSPNQTEEKMLFDLKPISSSEWVGLILNHDTRLSYPSIVILEDANSLRVRSCALGATFCAGQVWIREALVLAAAR